MNPDRILNRLVAEAAFRGSVEVELGAAHRRASEAETRAQIASDESRRLMNKCGDMQSDLSKLQNEKRDAEPKLRELYRAADQVLVEYRRQSRRNAPALVEAEGELRKALHDAFDYCDQLPF